jgi:glycosyltransferase involved in cell wall biosynthesis
VAAAAKTLQDVPLVVHVHDVLPESKASSLIRLTLRNRADAVIAISSYTAKKFAGGAEVRNIHTLHNPLNTEAFDPATKSRAEARSELGVPAHVPLMGVIAQITPWKGQDRAIDAFSLVHTRHPEARLILVGEAKFVGPGIRYDNLSYLKRLHERVAELGLGQSVEFWGERAEIPTIMRALDMLLVPSWEEPFGRSAIEAMAMETAVVATNLGGPAEYIEDGIDGVLLAPDDINRWADTIVDLLEDPAKREQLGRRASPKVRRLFDRTEYTRKVVEVYEQVIQDARPSRIQRPTSQQWSAAAAGANGRIHGKRMRILAVEHGRELGGGQRSLLELMRMLRREHEVVLACPQGPLAQAASALGISTVAIPESQLAFKLRLRATPEQFLRMLRARQALRNHLRRLQPDVVHANSFRAGLLTSGFHHLVPTVVHCRDLLPGGPAAWTVRAIVLRGNSMTIAVSRAVAARLGGEQWSNRALTVIDNPVDTDRFDPARWENQEMRRNLGLRGSPVVGIVAQITPWKGQIRALQVLERVRRVHPTAELLIVGEPKFVTAATSYDNRAYERELHAMVDQLGLQGAVRFLGEREDVERIIAGLDVLLVPSTEEPFGRSVIEALAMGVPVVATENGGPAEVIRRGIDGVLLPPDDLGSWARAVVAMAQRGRQLESREYVLGRFTPERHAAEVISVYERVISRWSREGARPLPLR